MKMAQVLKSRIYQKTDYFLAYLFSHFVSFSIELDNIHLNSMVMIIEIFK